MDVTGMWFVAITIAVGVGILLVLRAARQERRLREQRALFIRNCSFPAHLDGALREAYPSLSSEDVQLVHRAMRSYFLCWLQSGFRPVAMPSRAVDAFWHAYILDTRAYGAFCTIAFGRFFHHVPTALATQASGMGEAMQRSWRQCCAQEGIRPIAQAGVPLLFMIDERIGIPGAFRHDFDALRKASSESVAGSGGCGGGTPASDSGGGSDGGGCSSGCGGCCGGS